MSKKRLRQCDEMGEVIVGSPIIESITDTLHTLVDAVASNDTEKVEISLVEIAKEGDTEDYALAKKIAGLGGLTDGTIPVDFVADKLIAEVPTVDVLMSNEEITELDEEVLGDEIDDLDGLTQSQKRKLKKGIKKISALRQSIKSIREKLRQDETESEETENKEEVVAEVKNVIEEIIDSIEVDENGEITTVVSEDEENVTELEQAVKIFGKVKEKLQQCKKLRQDEEDGEVEESEDKTEEIAETFIEFIKENKEMVEELINEEEQEDVEMSEEEIDQCIRQYQARKARMKSLRQSTNRRKWSNFRQNEEDLNAKKQAFDDMKEDGEIDESVTFEEWSKKMQQSEKRKEKIRQWKERMFRQSRVVVPADADAAEERDGEGGDAKFVGRDAKGRRLVSVPKHGGARDARMQESEKRVSRTSKILNDLRQSVKANKIDAKIKNIRERIQQAEKRLIKNKTSLRQDVKTNNKMDLNSVDALFDKYYKLNV